jgi:hypothetical protein
MGFLLPGQSDTAAATPLPCVLARCFDLIPKSVRRKFDPLRHREYKRAETQTKQFFPSFLYIFPPPGKKNSGTRDGKRKDM